MLDRLTAIKDTGQIHLTLLIDTTPHIATLHIALNGLSLPDVMANLLIGGILLENKARFESDQLLPLDRQHTITESDIALCLLPLYLTHQVQRLA